jgi:hypothetical protein
LIKAKDPPDVELKVAPEFWEVKLGSSAETTFHRAPPLASSKTLNPVEPLKSKVQRVVVLSVPNPAEERLVG